LEHSRNYEFFLPSRDGDDIADINKISENFETIDEVLYTTENKAKSADSLANQAIEMATYARTEAENAAGTVGVLSSKVDEQQKKIEDHEDRISNLEKNEGGEGDFSKIITGDKEGACVNLYDIPAENADLEIRVNGSRKNLLPYPYSMQGGNGVTINSDYSVTLLGEVQTFNFYERSSLLTGIEVGEIYTFSVGTAVPDGIQMSVGFFSDYGDVNWYYINTGESQTTFKVPSGASEMTVYFYSAATYFENAVTFYPQLEKGETATPYAPYVDWSNVKVKRFGKNLCPIRKSNKTNNGVTFTVNDDGTITANGKAEGGDATCDVITTNVDERLPVGTTIYVSGCPVGGGTDKYYIDAIWLGKKDTGIGFKQLLSDSKLASNWQKTMSIVIKSGQIANGLVFKPQIEIGSAGTKYEPYVNPKEYAVSADATVQGVDVLVPSMTLVSNNDNAVIKCTYNRDANKTIEYLEQSILSLGGGKV
jgi:hypothetical protein